MKRSTAAVAALLSTLLASSAFTANFEAGKGLPTGGTPIIKNEALPRLTDAPLTLGAGANLQVPAIPSAQTGAGLELPAALPAALPGAQPHAEAAQPGALPALNAAEASFANAPKSDGAGVDAGTLVYDGVKTQGGFEPAFEPQTYNPPVMDGGDIPAARAGGEAAAEETPRRPAISFSNQAAKTALLAVDSSKSIYGIMKRLRGSGSKDYWAVYEKGTEIDVVIRGQSVFGQPTTITDAFNKPVGKLDRDDFKGLVPDYQLKAPIKQLRKMFMDRLEEDRKVWHANDEPVSAQTLVRIIKFKSYIDLYHDAHGKDAQPEPAPNKAREPLAVKPEGALRALSIFKPHVIFVDLDLFDGPVSQDFLSDMTKLQRMGIDFVAFSRKPYSAPGSMRDKLIHQMSSYQLSIQIPNRFMAVTDNGAVISMFPKGGSVKPVDVLGYSPAALEVLKDAAHKATEKVGLLPKSVTLVQQPAIREVADEFPGLTRREGSSRQDPAVRFEVAFDKGVSRTAVEIWKEFFDRWLQTQAMDGMTTISDYSDGRHAVTVSRTDLAGALPRLKEALGIEFGLYPNSNNILVLSEDPALRAANPDLDFAGLTGLKGAKLADNALGLVLGDNRQSQDGDRSGSASRISSFRRDRQQYMTEILIKEDAAEQNINFFSGHVVHSANDWVVHQLINGKRPTEAEYRAELTRRWDAGTREFKAIGMPQGETVDGMLRESTQRGVSMLKAMLAAQDRGEIIVGAEIPFEFTLRKYQKRTEAVKNRYHLHGQFDFVAIRPDPNKPGHGKAVIYDFKTGPAQSRQKLDKDIQVQLYTYYARHYWQGEDFPVPFLSGKKTIHIDSVGVEFIYNAVKQPTTVTNQDMDKTRSTILRTLDRIASTEAQLLGDIAPKPKAKPKAKGAKAAKKKPAAKNAKAPKAPSPKKKSA